MEKLDFAPKNLRKFGITLGIAFAVIGLIVFVRAKQSVIPTPIISGLFFILAFTAPAALKPVYIFWMRIAFILSWINTRIILIIIFYLFFMPIALALKLFRVDLLDNKIDKNKPTYWKKKEEAGTDKLSYQRQF